MRTDQNLEFRHICLIEAVNVEKNEWEKVPVFILIIKMGLYILFTVL